MESKNQERKSHEINDEKLKTQIGVYTMFTAILLSIIIAIGVYIEDANISLSLLSVIIGLTSILINIYVVRNSRPN
jgi:hypothetical protein